LRRTLVISDLHVGGRFHRSVLARPEPRARLLEALDGVQRLVLLGDTVELLEGRSQRALGATAALLREIAGALGREAEVVLVPGNHDRPLIRPWLRATGNALGIASEVPPAATPALRELCEQLSPAHVRVCYPGVWLSERVWATHGHYLDVHLIPVSTYGLGRGLLQRPPRDRARPSDYERARRPSLGRGAGWLPQVLGSPVSALAELVRAVTMPALRDAVLRPRIAPLTSSLLSLQMRRASMPALARVVHRLGVEADWVIFGHVHRLGPLAGDDVALWRGPQGSPRMANTGAWVWEPRLVNHASPPHPYWPGGAVLLEPGGEPRAVGLLDSLDAASVAIER
jgi:UDP-2,3-diacylglucosamine pyrophosphatase LpxH